MTSVLGLFLVLCFVLALFTRHDVVKSQWIDENEPCTTDFGRAGVCRIVEKCQEAIAKLKNRGRPKICGFKGKTPVVCCEDGVSPNFGEVRISVSDQKCEEYRQRTMTTTTTTTTTTTPPPNPNMTYSVLFAIGGVEALPLEFPHMALLGYGGPDDVKWQCGGTLISETHILTAAHCLRSRYGNVTYVKLGVHNILGINDFVQNYMVKVVYPHPEYVFNSHYHDIALIELDRPVVLRQKVGVKPACLHSERRLAGGELLVATGWGATELYGDLSETLQKVELRSVQFDNCAQFYRPQDKLRQGLSDDWQLCADGGGMRADTCQGDSGGPLQYPEINGGLHTVVGITSFGIKCAIVPAVYTRVSHYVPWIESVVWPN